MAEKQLHIQIQGQEFKLFYDPEDPCRSPRLDDRDLQPDCRELSPGIWSILLDSHSFILSIQGTYPNITVSDSRQTFEFSLKNDLDLMLDKLGMKGGNSKNESSLKASIPGLVKKIEVKPGDSVEKGQGLLILEAMKMENEIKSALSGKILKIHVEEGMTVEKNQVLMEIE